MSWSPGDFVQGNPRYTAPENRRFVGVVVVVIEPPPKGSIVWGYKEVTVRWPNGELSHYDEHELVAASPVDVLAQLDDRAR